MRLELHPHRPYALTQFTRSPFDGHPIVPQRIYSHRAALSSPLPLLCFGVNTTTYYRPATAP